MDCDFLELDDGFEKVFGLDERPFRLFDLPTELWLRICELAVTRNSPIDPTRARKAKQQTQVVKQPALARVSKVLRHEVLAAFYRNNVFEVSHLNGVACVRDWLVAIGPRNRKNMGILTFYCKFDADFWVDKFAQIGILVAAEVVGKVGGSIFQTLRFTFL